MPMQLGEVISRIATFLRTGHHYRPWQYRDQACMDARLTLAGRIVIDSEIQQRPRTPV
jgi:hypothetical protein